MRPRRSADTPTGTPLGAPLQPLPPLGGRGRISPRRRMLLALIVMLLGYLGFAYYVGLAFTTNAPSQDMDWDGDGVVTSREIGQAWYRVTAQVTTEGARTCRRYFWLGQTSPEPIRVACRTELGGGSEK